MSSQSLVSPNMWGYFFVGGAIIGAIIGTIRDGGFDRLFSDFQWNRIWRILGAALLGGLIGLVVMIIIMMMVRATSKSTVPGMGRQSLPALGKKGHSEATKGVSRVRHYMCRHSE